MSSKAKQVLLWLMIISSALVFVWYLQTKQTQPPKELSFDAAMTQIKNKDIKEVTVKQDTLELTNKSDVKFTAKLDASDSTRDQIFAAAKETDTIIKLEPASSDLKMPLRAVPAYKVRGADRSIASAMTSVRPRSVLHVLPPLVVLRIVLAAS